MMLSILSCVCWQSVYLLDQLRIRTVSGFILLSLIPSSLFFLSLRRSEFLTFIIFLLSEELLLVFCAQQVCWQWIPSAWLCLRKSLLCLHFQRIISPDIDCLVGGFFFQHFNCFTPLSSCVCGSWPEVWYDSYHCSSIVMAFPCFPWLLSRFHSLSVLLQLEYDILVVSVFILLGAFWAS